MLAILKNNWNRILEKKQSLFVTIGLTICSIVVAVFITSHLQVKGNIAFVTDQANVKIQSNKYLHVTVLKDAPPKSALLQNKYDAIVTEHNGQFSIDTIKNDTTKQMITNLVQNPATFKPDLTAERQIGTNIIGTMLMFLLIQGNLYTRMFAEDKEKKMITRVVLSPIRFSNYLFGHGVFIFSLIAIPTFLIISAMKLFHIAIGFSLPQYALLIGLCALLATSFGLFVNSLYDVADTANMIGSSVIVLTSILSGSFYSFTKDGSIFNKLLHILPQKDFMNFTNALEKNALTTNIIWQLVYFLLVVIVLFSFAVIKTRKDYIYKK